MFITQYKKYERTGLLVRHNLLSQLFFHNLADFQAGNPVEHSRGAQQNAKVIKDTNSEYDNCDDTAFCR
jgi:hypothetical protein